MKKKRLSVISIVLCLILCIALIPTSAAALLGPTHNDKYYAILKVTKTIEQADGVDETLIDKNNALSQVEFTLYANEDIINPLDGSIITKKNEIGLLRDPNTKDFSEKAIITTHTNGLFTLENIPVGKYLLTETKVPDGFVKPESATPITFNSGENEVHPIVEHSITNYTIKTKFSNTDASGATMLEGSTLALYRKDGTPVTKIDTAPLTWTSTAQAYFLEGLPVGEYFLRQTASAPSYVLRTSELPFTVENTKDVQTFTMNNKKVTLEKADIAKKKILGAAISVTDKKTGALVDSWVDDGTPHTILNLIEGHTYTVHETKPANSTITFQDMEFTVNSDYSKDQALLWDAYTCTHCGGTATTTKKAICEVCKEEYGELISEAAPDEPSTSANTSPKTGDNANILLPILGLLLSSAAISLLVIRKKIKNS